eukprot:CAMPEP_0167749062 /NCGR_PEP_ID=MMETSP0110_2-20121227/5190_1 /TAXON_ID=629695 /ORGANISM="Gymnochlora sp., Strain CCMP2014" /LENGTH=673 /DNA_ID=CAMNT_0007634157 /DNA_START=166 /DNA_END=2187 /DNA_ORIENTATION=+
MLSLYRCWNGSENYLRRPISSIEARKNRFWSSIEDSTEFDTSLDLGSEFSESELRKSDPRPLWRKVKDLSSPLKLDAASYLYGFGANEGNDFDESERERRGLSYGGAYINHTFSGIVEDAEIGANNRSFKSKEYYNAEALASNNTRGYVEPVQIRRRYPGPNEVLLEITHCGISRYDMQYLRAEWGERKYRYPMIPGLEIVGIISTIGDNVTQYKKGDRVGVFPLVGKQQLGGGSESLISAERNGGGLSTRATIHKNRLIRIPPKLPTAPLMFSGGAVYSCLKELKQRALSEDAQKDLYVGILGYGCLGHISLKLAKKFGFKVVVISMSEHKKVEVLSEGADFLKYELDSTPLFPLPKRRGFGRESTDSAEISAGGEYYEQYKSYLGCMGNRVVQQIHDAEKWRHKLIGIIDTLPISHELMSFLPLMSKDRPQLHVLGLPRHDLTFSPSIMAKQRVRYYGWLGAQSIEDLRELIEFVAGDETLFPNVRIASTKNLHEEMLLRLNHSLPFASSLVVCIDTEFRQGKAEVHMPSTVSFPKQWIDAIYSGLHQHEEATVRPHHSSLYMWKICRPLERKQKPGHSTDTEEKEQREVLNQDNSGSNSLVQIPLSALSQLTGQGAPSNDQGHVPDRRKEFLTTIGMHGRTDDLYDDTAAERAFAGARGQTAGQFNPHGL